MAEHSPVLCVGGIHFDCIAQSLTPFKLKASNPVRTTRTAGGVAHNIACDLVRLGTPASLLSLVGDDADGRALVAESKQMGVDLVLLSQRKSIKTAGYTAVLDMAGELVVGLSETETYDLMTPDFLRACGDWLHKYESIVVDANLPAISLEWLGTNKGPARLFAAPVSPSKALRWKRAMPNVDVFVGNEHEAHQLTGLAVKTVTQALQAARALRSLGPGTAVVTLGPQGAVVSCPEIEAYFAAPTTHMVDVNGAGDAFFAGFTHTLNADFPVEQAMAKGIACASIMAETTGPVWQDLPPDLVNTRLKAVLPGKKLS